MAADLAWADIATFVEDVLRDEGTEPNRRLIVRLGRQALGIISDRIGPVLTSWSNGVGGALTLAGNSAPLPTDCLRVDRVEWDGSDNPLTRMSVAQLDYEQPGWREDTGEPGSYTIEGGALLLDTTPTESVTGKLVVRGAGSLPMFSDEATDPNPLAYLTQPHQLAPAHFILGSLRADPKQADQMARKAEHWGHWERELAALGAAIGRREREPFEA